MAQQQQQQQQPQDQQPQQQQQAQPQRTQEQPQQLPWHQQQRQQQENEPYLILLAPHVQPRPGWLDSLRRVLNQHERAAVVGIKLLMTGDMVYHAGMIVDAQRWPRRLYAGFPGSHPAVNTSRYIQMVSGAAMLVRRAAFDAVGGFDDALDDEDAALDLCLRLRERGYDVYYCHESVATIAPPPETISAAWIASKRRFRTRWLHKLEQDDVNIYAADRLLHIRYDTQAAPHVEVSPPLAVVSPDPRAADELLTARAHQVHALLEENARLSAQVAALTVASTGASAGASAGATAASLNTVDGHDLLPPPALALSVGGAFRETGEEFFAYFTEIGRLRPTEAVLEVGCGVGRMAVPLTRYLTDGGRYEGFDVMANAIAWCQEHITSRFPAFTFQHVALHNRAYNTGATTRSTDFAFPYPAESFDFVFLTSVFTHLLPDEVQHYLAQIARVLKPGGRCFSTFFLLNPESTGLIQVGLSPQFPFAHRGDGFRVQDADVPEAAIAYDETLIRDWYHTAGLIIPEPVRYGFWCGRLDGLSLQDIVLATKRSHA